MSTIDPKSWDPELSHLLGAERRNISAPSDAEDRVWGRLAVTLPPPGSRGSEGGGGASGATGRAARPWATSKGGAAGLYALGVITGVVATALVLGNRALPSRGSAQTEPARVERETTPPPLVALLTATADASREGPPRAEPPPRPTTTGDTLEAERRLLDAARAALGNGDGASALRTIDAHARRYPDGLLAEEREAMAVQALLLVSQYDEAKKREALFEQRYPRSMLLQAVRASLRSIP